MSIESGHKHRHRYAIIRPKYIHNAIFHPKFFFFVPFFVTLYQHPSIKQHTHAMRLGQRRRERMKGKLAKKANAKSKDVGIALKVTIKRNVIHLTCHTVDCRTRHTQRVNRFVFIANQLICYATKCHQDADKHLHATK